MYQLQQDKKRLREEVERGERESGELRQEVDLLRNRLEETEWALCQKSGELALLKSQLKETQVTHQSIGQECRESSLLVQALSYTVFVIFWLEGNRKVLSREFV